MPNAVQYKGRTVNVGTIPIGIDPEKFTDVSLPLSTFPCFPHLPAFVRLRGVTCYARSVRWAVLIPGTARSEM